MQAPIGPLRAVNKNAGVFVHSKLDYMKKGQAALYGIGLKQLLSVISPDIG